MAVMFDKSYFEFLQTADINDTETLKEVIRKSVELKAWVVNQDEKEAGIRAVLNYGHTFGHVVENETHYTTYLHGEAVAIGIVMANALAIELGMFTQEEAQEVKALLEKASLPTEYAIKNVDEFYEHFFLDKKSAKGSIKFILPNGMGNHKIVSDISESIVKKVLRSFGEEK
jgi:3-dehydroquinate synthase